VEYNEPELDNGVIAYSPRAPPLQQLPTEVADLDIGRLQPHDSGQPVIASGLPQILGRGRVFMLLLGLGVGLSI